MLGLLLINIYAFLIIISTFIVFISKSRLKQVEDELYKKFLIVNIIMSLSGLVLGVLVSSESYYNELVIVLTNKLYLFSLLWWIYLLTYYYIYISFKDKDKVLNFKNKAKVFAVISTLLIFLLPISVEISDSGAVASGIAILYTYTIFGLAFLFQIVCVFINFKNYKNKKYIPLYLLILMGITVLVCMLINPSLNYIVNPGFIFVSYIMYHTIENPDIRMIEELNKSKTKLESTTADNRKLIDNITEDLRKVNYDMAEIVNIVSDTTEETNTREAMHQLSYLLSNNSIKLNNALDISSMDVRNLKLTNSKYNLRKIVKEIDLRLKNSISEDISYQSVIADSIPEVLYGEVIKIKQILVSLLDNAIKYTKAGRIELRFNSVVKDDICKLFIVVDDTGCGMNLHQINDIMVHDADLTEEDLERCNELNLNLKIIKKIIQVMGGTINIDSKLNKGTKVVITLNQKIYREIDKEAKHIEELEKQIFDKKHIAIVCDDNALSKKIIKVLDKVDAKKIECKHAKECIDKIRKDNNIDLIICQENMDKINARELLKKVTKEEYNVPIIMVTNNNDYDLKRIKVEGFASCLSEKEISLELVKKVDRILNK
ncbi:MAG: ATP-binding protein [Bacilli bacterium]